MGSVPNLGPVLIAVISVCIGITSLAMLLRCYVRIVMQKWFRVDDYLILFSQVCYYAYVYCVLQETHHGLGMHVKDIVRHNRFDLPIALKCFWIAQQFYNLAISSFKICVAIFFIALRPPRGLRITAIFAACVSVGHFIRFVCLQVLQCRLISFYWDIYTTPPKCSCISINKRFLYLQVLNGLDISTDIVLAILPSLMVRKMMMKRGEKLIVAALLGLGACPAISAIARGV